MEPVEFLLSYGHRDSPLEASLAEFT